MPFFLGERKILGLNIDQTNYVVKETRYKNPDQLLRDFPEGNEFAYMVGEEGSYSVFVWSNEQHLWMDVGNYGPIGDSLVGPRGFKGVGIDFRTSTDSDGNICLEWKPTDADPDEPYNLIANIMEGDRQSNETERINNENARIEQELTRQQNESNRNNEETQRQVNEQQRIESETIRLNKETEREAAEQSRISNEDLRVQTANDFQSFIVNREFVYGEEGPITTRDYNKYNIVWNLQTNKIYECIKTNPPIGTSLLDTTYFRFILESGSAVESLVTVSFSNRDSYNSLIQSDNSPRNGLYLVYEN